VTGAPSGCFVHRGMSGLRAANYTRTLSDGAGVGASAPQHATAYVNGVRLAKSRRPAGAGIASSRVLELIHSHFLCWAWRL